LGKKKNRKYYIILATLFLVLVVVELLKPKTIDWTLTFSKEKTTPFGSWGLYKLLNEKNQTETNTISLYEYFKNNQSPKNPVIITDVFKPDATDIQKLFSHVESGGSALISAFSFNSTFSDSLNFEVARSFKNDKIGSYFHNPHLNSNKHYPIQKTNFAAYFSDFDSTKTNILGYNGIDSTNFIKIMHGKGYFLINLNPFLFTNYEIINEANYEYPFKCLAYMDMNSIIWDEYYKPNKFVASTPMRYILRSKGLSSAYFVLLTGIIIFLLFESKRKQKIIPIIRPPVNLSLSYISSIAHLYLHKKDNIGIINKRMRYLMEHIRLKYYLKTHTIDKDFIQDLHDKTGISRKKLRLLFEQWNAIRSKNRISFSELSSINHKIEEIYKLGL